MKTRVAVIFGGHSVEHEVSIISGLQALNALNKDKYEAFPLYISKDNCFGIQSTLRLVYSSTYPTPLSLTVIFICKLNKC